MECDGPTGASVLFQYSGLISVLVNIKQKTPHQGLSDMIEGMVKQLRDYQTEALHCDPIVMATILNPRLRLEYIRNKYPDYAARSEDLFRLTFSIYEENHFAKTPTPEVDQEDNQPFDPLDETNAFTTSATHVLTSDEEIDQYFSGMHPCERDTDILKWWSLNQKRFPKIAKLARDFLACVGSSSAVERTFSTAAIVCSNRRGGLTSRSIERAVGVCQWLKQKFVPDGELGKAVAAVEQLVAGLAKKKKVAKV